jgi:hypothetical protein
MGSSDFLMNWCPSNCATNVLKPIVVIRASYIMSRDTLEMSPDLLVQFVGKPFFVYVLKHFSVDS